MLVVQPPVDCPEVQAAVYRVALALDAFLLNGIQFGILQPVADGFVQSTADTLLSDLAALEEQAQHTPATNRMEVAEVLADLRNTCQRLVELVIELRSFRTLSLGEMRATVRQIPTRRATCVQLIQRLEGCLRTPTPFYPSRPAHSTSAVDDFLATLEGVLIQARDAST